MELLNISINNFGDQKAETKLSHIINDKKIIKPDFQRDIDIVRCDHIVNNMNLYYKKYGYYKIIGTIYLAKKDDNYYIIDGQHRLYAASKILDIENIDISIDIHIYNCNKMEDIFEYFQLLNFNQCIPKWMQGDSKDNVLIIKNIINKICEKYGDLIVKTDINVQMPKFNISKFFDILKKYNIIDNKSEDEIISFLENINTNVYLSLNKYKTNENINKKLEKIIFKNKFGSHIWYLGAIRLSSWDKFFKKKMYENINEDIIINLFII